MKRTTRCLLVSGVLALVAAGSGCGGSGLCVSTGGRPEECHEGWSEAECQDWQTKKVNGATWRYYGSGTCQARGFTARCANGTYVYSFSDC